MTYKEGGIGAQFPRSLSDIQHMVQGILYSEGGIEVEMKR
jgi:hypothetical protein